MNTIPSGSEMLVYQAPNGAIELKGDIEHETIWANQSHIAEIFGVDRTVISRHISNIFKDKELDKEEVSAKFAHTTQHGAIPGKTQRQSVMYYNLDIILAVGYRVKSSMAVKFRQRATQTLRQHITQGYTINPGRITLNYQAFLTAVEEVQLLNTQQSLGNDQVVELIKMFAHTWFSLDAYDKEGFSSQGQTQQSISLHADELYADIALLKKQLIEKGEATELFAQEKQKESLAGILGNVFQTVGGQEVYPSIESKGAHLLYFIVKNHPFTDGNKRSGAFATSNVRAVSVSGVIAGRNDNPAFCRNRINAKSDPKDKERVIELIILLLQGK